jgi:hypothetical protein
LAVVFYHRPLAGDRRRAIRTIGGQVMGMLVANDRKEEKESASRCKEEGKAESGAASARENALPLFGFYPFFQTHWPDPRCPSRQLWKNFPRIV